MRLLIALLILWLAAAVFVYPPLVESSDGECSALEQRYADLASQDGSGLLRMSSYYGSSSSIPGAAGFAKDRYPLLPSAVGCTLAFWKSVIGNPDPVPASAARPAAPPEQQAPAASAPVPAGITPTLARDITPNGAPISPATIFTLPMDAVAVRVEYPGGRASAARFQLLQGRAVLAACRAEQAGPGIAWCKFNVSLRKGNYSISFTAGNALLGQFPFTVIGR